MSAQGSPEVIDLLQKMLVADPAERITVPQMLEHPWVRQGLPPACLPLNDHLLQVSAARWVAPMRFPTVLFTEKILHAYHSQFANRLNIWVYGHQVHALDPEPGDVDASSLCK